MVQLAEQIAVLDGLGAIRPGYADGRTGANRAAVDQYGRAVMRGVLNRRNVIDAGEGANYGGGSSYAAGMPLMPSTIGLADMPGTLPTRMHVIDPSGGANYSGGASYAPGIPLLSSTVGLAAAIGAAGGSAADQDLAGAFNALGAIRPGYADGRTGANRAAVDQYGRPVMRGVLSRKNVLDASEGANYAGGSSYAAGLPLMPSSVGLAGSTPLPDHDLLYLSVDRLSKLGHRVAVLEAQTRAIWRALPPDARNTANRYLRGDQVLDGLGDLAWGGWLRKLPSSARQSNVLAARNSVLRAAAQLRSSAYGQKPNAAQNLQKAVLKLREIRAVRRNQVVKSIRGGVPVTTSRPYSPSGMGALTVMRGGVPVTVQDPYSPALAMWK